MACVAAFCHISVCIAGATTSGAAVARTVVPSRSSARPAASFASVFAVAGRDDDQVGGLPERDVAHLGDALVEVGVDRVAADRLERRPADEAQRGRGRHDVHVVAREHERAHDADGLVGRDAAGDPDDDLHRRAPRGSERPRGSTSRALGSLSIGA